MAFCYYEKTLLTVLTSQRLFISEPAFLWPRDYHVFALDSIVSFEFHKGWLSHAVEIQTNEKKDAFKSDSLPDSEFLAFAIEQAKKNPTWGNPAVSAMMTSAQETAPEKGPETVACPTAADVVEESTPDRLRYWLQYQKQSLVEHDGVKCASAGRSFSGRSRHVLPAEAMSSRSSGTRGFASNGSFLSWCCSAQLFFPLISAGRRKQLRPQSPWLAWACRYFISSATISG